VEQPAGRRLHDLQFSDASAAKSLHFREPRLWRRDHLGKRAEFREQHLGERLDIAAWQRAKQQQFQ
jgi:hypothetical protein